LGFASVLDFFGILSFSSTGETGKPELKPFLTIFGTHMRATLAKEQLKKALPSVVRIQNKDGSWGTKEKETATFLILDALRNTGDL
jgi:hypothetical protein